MQNARFLRLTRNVGKGGGIGVDGEVVADVFDGKGGTFFEVDGRQLGVVTDEQQLAAVAFEDVGEEVVHQTFVAEERGVAGAVGNHRGLVHNKERVNEAVGAAGELTDAVARLGPIQAFVDGVGLLSGIEREDFCGTAGGCEKDAVLLHHFQGSHQGAHQGGFTGTGVTVKDK